MRYLGMDVHAKWCLVDAQGEVVCEGHIPTTAAALAALVRELAQEEPVLAGQEVGTLTYLVHDAVTAAGTMLLSFNAQHLPFVDADERVAVPTFCCALAAARKGDRSILRLPGQGVSRRIKPPVSRRA